VPQRYCTVLCRFGSFCQLPVPRGQTLVKLKWPEPCGCRNVQTVSAFQYATLPAWHLSVRFSLKVLPPSQRTFDAGYATLGYPQLSMSQRVLHGHTGCTWSVLIDGQILAEAVDNALIHGRCKTVKCLRVLQVTQKLMLPSFSPPMVRHLPAAVAVKDSKLWDIKTGGSVLKH